MVCVMVCVIVCVCVRVCVGFLQRQLHRADVEAMRARAHEQSADINRYATPIVVGRMV
jgi:hypothetical protein